LDAIAKSRSATDCNRAADLVVIQTGEVSYEQQCIVVWIYVYVNVEQLGWIGLEKSSDLKNTNGVALLGYRKPMVAWIRSQPF